MLNPNVRKYLLAGLSGTPAVIAGLLADFSPDDYRWDTRPYPDRFTMREMAAHVADWDDIWLERIKRIATEDKPILPDVDEDQVSIERDYAHQDPIANLQRLAARRAEILQYLTELPDAAWGRVGIRPPSIGEIEMDGLAAIILGHDGYHTKQAAEYVKEMQLV